MSFYLHLAPIEQAVARVVLERNVLNSQRLIAGDFESALADIIQQLEHPPVSRGAALSPVEMTRRIGRALREGLIGLSPNGFEFGLWLWDVAPLHVVNLGTRPLSGEMHAAGVLQLRRIAAIVFQLYIDEQPQRLESVIPLLDSSVDWVDARQLIVYAMLDHYLTSFEISYQSLLALAREPKPWRALVPLEVGKEMLAEKPEYTAMALAFLNATQRMHDQERMRIPLRLFLRSAIRYGDGQAMARYFSSHEMACGESMMEAVSLAVPKNRAPHPACVRETLLPMLLQWKETAPPGIGEAVRKALAALGEPGAL
jgi:hypothetical protein